VSRKCVIRLMQEDGLKARVRKRFTCTTQSDHGQPVADNLLDRDFTADAPNHRWVGDTTEFLIGQSGKRYLAVILDLFSRFAVRWAFSAANDRHLAVRALEMALSRLCSTVGCSIIPIAGVRMPAPITRRSSRRTGSRAA
jgi:putative transposase